MKITLKVTGREENFSKTELIELREILENYFANQKIERPLENSCFEVNPKAISPNLFAYKRKNSTQEWTRRTILEALKKVKEEPEKYAKPFKTKMPKKTWNSKTVPDLKEIASNQGHHMADWVEQALEWAQRIANGETWEAVCNEADTANHYRLITWRDGSARTVGGSKHSIDDIPASHVSCIACNPNNKQYNIVPLIISYD